MLREREEANREADERGREGEGEGEGGGGLGVWETQFFLDKAKKEKKNDEA